MSDTIKIAAGLPSAESASGPSLQFVAAQQFGRFRSEADISEWFADPDLMSTRPNWKDVSVVRSAQFLGRARFVHDWRVCQCSRWVFLVICAADPRKVSGPDVFRNQAKSARDFKGHSPEQHFQVRIQAPQRVSVPLSRRFRLIKNAREFRGLARA
jgi:hypothetical protein